MSSLYALVFAKYPHPGEVKTRLLPCLTRSQAAKVHELSLIAVLETLETMERLKHVLVGTPDEKVAGFRHLAPSIEVWAQGSGDLGSRLERSVDRAFDQGATGVLLLGADSPALAPSIIQQAAGLVDEGQAVIGPCDDGGYYLLGLPKRCGWIFRGIDWGSPHVLRDTLASAARRGLSLHSLERSYDLDRPVDLRRTCRDLQAVDEKERPALAVLRNYLESLLDGRE